MPVGGACMVQAHAGLAAGTCRQGSVVVLQDWFHLLQQHSKRTLCSLLPPCHYTGKQPFNGLLLPAITRVVTRVVTAQGSY